MTYPLAPGTLIPEPIQNQGLVDTSNFSANNRPFDWIKDISKKTPNFNSPLTLISNATKKLTGTDPRYLWSFKAEIDPQGTFTATNVFNGTNLVTPVTGTPAADTTVYIKLGINADNQQSIANFFVPKNLLLLRNTSSHLHDRIGLVTAVVIDPLTTHATTATNTSYIAVKLLDSGQTGSLIETIDSVMKIGSAHAEGDQRPSSIATQPIWVTNYTQIHRKALGATGTALATTLRDPKTMQTMKSEAFFDVTLSLERSIIYGQPRDTVDAVSSRPLRTSGGALWMLRTYVPENILDYRTDPDFSGTDWIDGGIDWLEKVLNTTSLSGAKTKLAVSGRLAQTGLSKALRIQHDIAGKDGLNQKFGFSVKRYETPFVNIDIADSQAFSMNVGEANSMFLFSSTSIAQKTLRPMIYFETPQYANQGEDAKYGEFLAEIGWVFPNPYEMAFLTGVGLDNDGSMVPA